jgi:hypothetical protein
VRKFPKEREILEAECTIFDSDSDHSSSPEPSGLLKTDFFVTSSRAQIGASGAAFCLPGSYLRSFFLGRIVLSRIA